MMLCSIFGFVYWLIGVLASLTALALIIGFVLFLILIKRPSPNRPEMSPDSYLTRRLMGTHAVEFGDFNKEYRDKMQALPATDIEVQTTDGLTLRAKLYLCGEQTSNIIIYNHGYNSCGENEAGPFVDMYHKLGYSVLVVNHRAHGPSDGKYIGFGVLDSRDASLWVAALTDRYPQCHIAIHGVSMGAATTMQLSNTDLPDNVKCLIEDCGFTSCMDEFTHQAKYLFHIPSWPLVNIAEFFSKNIAGYDFTTVNSIDAVAHSKFPILFIHGEADAFVPADMSRRAYAACTAEKELVLYPNAPHAMSYMLNQEDYSQHVKEFLEKYM